MDDIAPVLLEAIREDFNDLLGRDRIIKRLYDTVSAGKAGYKELNEFAVKVGETLASSFDINLSADELPNGKMYVNIAQKLLEPTMSQNYDLITEMAKMVQQKINDDAGLHVAVSVPKLNEDRIKKLAFKAGSYETFEEAKWCFGEPVVNAAQSVVDDFVEENAGQMYRMGLTPKLIRKESGNCCEWCAALAGTYDYPDVPKDVYRRHRFCRCTVEFYPGDGSMQDVHSKRWYDASTKNTLGKPVDVETIKSVKGRGYDVTKEYFSDAIPGRGNRVYEDGFDKKHRQDEIDTANIIFNELGGEIVHLTEKQGQKNPDYKWDGRLWDLKSTSSEKSANSAIKSGLKQIRDNPGGVILNFGDHEISMDKLIKTIDLRMAWYPDDSADIMIITNGKINKILHY